MGLYITSDSENRHLKDKLEEKEDTLQGKEDEIMNLNTQLSLVATRYQITENELRNKEEREKQLTKVLYHGREEYHQMQQKYAECERLLGELESYYQCTKGARGASLVDQAKAREKQICAEMERQFQERIQHIEKSNQHLVEERVRREERQSWIVERQRVELDKSKCLGIGAFGSVFPGKFCGTQVAVKVYREVVSAQDIRSCEQEMVMASRLRHENVVQFMAAVVDGLPLWMVTELATGGTLGDLWKKRSLLPCEVSSFALDVAQGLLYMHSHFPKPILHRDLHLNNVLIFERGLPQGRIAKLSDFGTANFERIVMSPNRGTPILNAPETRTHQYTTKADVYSFGVIPFMMCFNDWRNQLQKGSDLSLQKLAELLSEDSRNQLQKVFDTSLQKLINDCIADDPLLRPNMQEVVNKLEKLKKNYPSPK